MIRMNEKISNLITNLRKDFNISTELINALEKCINFANILDNRESVIQTLKNMYHIYS